VLDALHGISRGARLLPRGNLNRNWTCFRAEGQVYLSLVGTEAAKIGSVWWIRGLGWGVEGFLVAGHSE
jgi:hypothetical protein